MKRKLAILGAILLAAFIFTYEGNTYQAYALDEEDLRHVLNLVPTCSLIRFDCGHAIHIEKPKAFVSALCTMI